MNFNNNNYENLLNFWKEKETLPAAKDKKRSEQRTPSQAKITEKATEAISPKNTPITSSSKKQKMQGKKESFRSTRPQKGQKFEKLRNLFEQARPTQPSPERKASPRRIEIPQVFLQEEAQKEQSVGSSQQKGKAVIPQASKKEASAPSPIEAEKEARRKLKGKEKESIEETEARLREEQPAEEQILQTLEQKIARLHQKLDEDPNEEEFEAIQEKYNVLIELVEERNIKLGDLESVVAYLGARIAAPKESIARPSRQPAPLEVENPAPDLAAKISVETEVIDRTNQKITTITLAEEQALFTLQSIAEDVETLKSFLKENLEVLKSFATNIENSKTFFKENSEILKSFLKENLMIRGKFSKKVTGLSRSYTVSPRGRISVHLKTEEKVQIGKLVKKGKIGGGAFKKAKLMQEVDKGTFEVRGILAEALDPSTRSRVFNFIRDMRGEEHICQMDYVQWFSKRKKTSSIMDVNKKGGRKEAFISEFYPFTGEEVISLIQENRIPSTLYIPIALQLAYGVQSMHQKGWVHRDLKPGNIFFQWDPSNPTEIKVAIGDFDTVHKTNDANSTNESTGTPGYIPPEYGIEELISDAKPADIYALGVTLLEMFMTHGPAPWKKGAENVAQLMYLPIKGEYKQTLEELRQNATTPFERLILEMCQSDPQARPSIEEVIKRLESML
ncbi:protein kinase [Parachlamydia sp. AcF125]|uniref:serine/threonine protein kinase n=1 Tax=Parachlamydia sp. AcF125 TaxID=2795736 RepID=UPI001BC8EB84|nr:protein kinase [Parachlamydia sp. AcF125]MBS4168692.1 Serine/threonine-protein kinase StkP [Parachlamydia sp. AcF125]